MLRTGRERGYTLLETLIVLIIISVVLGLTLPSLIGLTESVARKTEQRKIIKLLEEGRKRAITSGTTQEIIVRNSSMIYQLSETERIDYQLSSIEVGHPMINNGTVFFYPDGSSSGLYLPFVLNNGERYYLEVDGVSGKGYWRGYDE